jgi:hypothetical protein
MQTLPSKTLSGMKQDLNQEGAIATLLKLLTELRSPPWPGNWTLDSVF